MLLRSIDTGYQLFGLSQVLCQRCRKPGEVALPAGEGGGRSRHIDVAGSCAHCHHDWYSKHAQGLACAVGVPVNRHHIQTEDAHMFLC